MLTHLQIDVTNRCNMNCRHCRNGRLRPEEITQLNLAEFTDVVDQALALGCQWINVCGGEPMVHPNILQLVEYASHRCHTNLLTNGYLIDLECAESLRAAGVGMVQLSLDGASPQVHNTMRRNKHAFERVVRAVDALHATGIPVCFMVTMSRANYETLPRIMQVAQDLGVDFVNLRRLIPQGNGSDGFDQLGLNRTEVASLLAEARRLEIDHSIGICLFPFYPFGDDQIVAPYRANREPEPCAGCSAGVSGLAVASDGAILLCPHIPMPLGNIRTHSLADVWARHETVLALRGRTQLKGRCGVCEFRNVCGGCRAYPYQLTGDLMGEDDLCTVTAGIEEPVPC